MKALIYEGPSKMVLSEVKEPPLKKNEVKIHIKASGICGLDIHGYLGISGRRTAPMIMGHEFSGEVVEIDPGVKHFAAGDRVTVEPKLFCNNCEMCRERAGTICAHRENFGEYSRKTAVWPNISMYRRTM